MSKCEQCEKWHILGLSGDCPICLKAKLQKACEALKYIAYVEKQYYSDTDRERARQVLAQIEEEE